MEPIKVPDTLYYMPDTLRYPSACLSANCACIESDPECQSCPRRPDLDLFNLICEETGAWCEDEIWSPTFYRVPAGYRLVRA